MGRMARKYLGILSALLACLMSASTGLVHAAPVSAIQAPVLKWKYAGCYSSWCETGWYSSPAVADLDGDGQAEVVGSAYSIVELDGATGALDWRVGSGRDRSTSDTASDERTWPGIVITDIEPDGEWDIITAHAGGIVSVYDQNGYFQPGWPQNPTPNELRGLSVYDLDGDGATEIVVTAGISNEGDTLDVWVYEPDGTLRPGWPQLSNDSGYASGIYNANTSIKDFDDDGQVEIVVPSDMHYINAYTVDGVQIPANAMYGDVGWGKVGVWESMIPELRGWGRCNGERTESYRANFAHGASDITDLDGDGDQEVVAVGNVYDCSDDNYPSKYRGLFIFNPDRSHYNQDGYDWSTPPLDTGAPLSEDYYVIEGNQPNPVVADLDGDGHQEILFSAYDGRIHAFWLDKTEHGSWPYSVYTASEGVLRFSSEPAVVDLDNNGQAEVIFTTWTQIGKYQSGDLLILSSQGELLQSVPLPAGKGSATWNGGLPAPTVANLDADADLELVINTGKSGFVAYDLPGTSSARILWGTRRGTSLRSGSIPEDILQQSSLVSLDTGEYTGGTIPLQLTLDTYLSDLISVNAEITLASGLQYSGDLTASSGTVSESGGTITWSGTLSGDSPVTVRFSVTPEVIPDGPQWFVNELSLDDGYGRHTVEARPVLINGYVDFLPQAMH